MPDPNEVALRLKLDGKDAKDEVSGVVKALDGLQAKFETWGAELENSLKGRLIKNALGAFKDQFATTLNDELPRVVRETKLADALTVAFATSINEGLGRAASAVIAATPRPELQTAQGTLDLLNQFTFGGRVPLSAEEAKKMYGPLQDAVAARLQAQKAQRDALDEAQEAYFQSHPGARPAPLSKAGVLRDAKAAVAVTSGAGSSFWDILPWWHSGRTTTIASEGG